MQTYITLVSEQAIPNVQYIKEFADKIGTYLFISTEWMESKKSAQHIIDACGLQEKQYKVLVVNPESLSDILNKLDSILKADIFKNTEGYIVNCTLGNKVMSIALYEYFRENKLAKILYSSIDSNSYKGLIDESYNDIFRHKVTVSEYLKSYGVTLQNSSKPLFLDILYSELFLNYFIGQELDFRVLDTLRTRDEITKNGEMVKKSYRDSGVNNLNLVEGLSELLEKIQFPVAVKNQLSKNEVRYLTGGWFEEWTYYKIKNFFKLIDDEIVLGLNTVKDAPNDLDVVFIHRNSLKIIECKTSMAEKEIQNNTLYKSGALIEKFGKNAKSYIFTLSNIRSKDGKLKESILLRSLQQNIILADRETILKGFDNFLKLNF